MPATPRDLSAALYHEPENPAMGARLVEAARRAHYEPARTLTSEELEDLPDPAWYLEHFIQEDSLTIVYGPPKTGKTFLCVEWANRLALGKEWLGHRALPVRVLYASAEGNKSLGMRNRALREYYDLPSPENLRWLPGVTQLFYRGETRPQAQQELFLAIEEFKPHVVFFDTLARHNPGGDVASNHDMSLVVKVADEIRAGFGCSVVFVHHTRKDGGDYLGATALFGAVDSMIQLSPSETRGKFNLWAVTKELDDYSPPWTFQIVPAGGSAVISEGTQHLSSRTEEVYDYIATNGPVTAGDIQSDLFTPGSSDSKKYIRSLAAAGRIEQDGERAEGLGRPSKLWTAVSGPDGVEYL